VRALQEEAESVRFERYEGPEHPDVIRFLAEDSGTLEALASRTGVAVQRYASVSILSCLPRITDLYGWHAREATLPFGRDWKVGRFEVMRRRCRWVDSSVEEANKTQDGLFRFTRFQREHYLRLDRRTYRVGGQVGKFYLVVQRRRQLLRYDRVTRQLTVPDICRPPLLVDRALVLCSGSLPRYDSGSGTLTYKEVPEGVAGKTATILCQEWI
jgi:hypothetical protein